MDLKLKLMKERNLYESILVYLGRQDLIEKVKSAAESENFIEATEIVRWVENAE